MNPWSALQDRVLGRVMRPPSGSLNVPPGVTLREGRLIPAFGGFFARMGGPAAAVTLRRTIIVHPSAVLTPRLLAHELTHVQQWSEDAWFPLRYTWESLRRGYRQNRYEVAARAAERNSQSGGKPPSLA